MAEILLLINIILGYWAVGETIWANRIMIGQYKLFVMKRIVIGLFLGWALIPIAIIKRFLK